MAYKAYVAELKNVEKDPKSDNLYTATVMGEGVIVGGSSADGQEVLYLPADGQLDYDFAMAFGLLRKDKNGQPAGGYLDENRHIKALKLRGLRSEGIVIPLEKVVAKYPDILDLTLGDWREGFDKLGDWQFCKKYIPRGSRRGRGGGAGKSSYKGRKAEGVTYPEFAMHTDTGQLAYNEAAFYAGDLVSISLKVHGTSQRSMMTYAELPNGFFRRLFRMKKRTKPAYVLGTRRVVVTNDKGGFYGDDSFRIAHHEALRPYIPEGMEVFYEVVGWVNKEKTIMPVCDNRKLKDKKFTKMFGDQTAFLYGTEQGLSRIFVYRITYKGEDLIPSDIIAWCKSTGEPMIQHAPIIDEYRFTTWEDLTGRVNDYFQDLRDPIDPSHIKEGVVVRIVERDGRQLPFRAFKSKTYEFKVLEGIIKESAVEADMEEAQEEDA